MSNLIDDRIRLRPVTHIIAQIHHPVCTGLINIGQNLSQGLMVAMDI